MNMSYIVLASTAMVNQLNGAGKLSDTTPVTNGIATDMVIVQRLGFFFAGCLVSIVINRIRQRAKIKKQLRQQQQQQQQQQQKINIEQSKKFRNYMHNYNNQHRK